MVRAALKAVDAGLLVQNAFSRLDISRAMRSATAVDVLAVGKSAAAMLNACVEASDMPLRHVIGISPYAPDGLPAGAEWHTAAHPIPDERSVIAARAALATAAAGAADNLLLVLLSGGASSAMTLPAASVTLGDKRQTSARLLEEGAEIHELNAVRKHISGIKGGQLAAATPAAVVTLAVSDVIGDDLSSIGSGPTVADPTTFAEALAVLERHGGRGGYPAAVQARLVRGAAGDFPETPKPGDVRLSLSTAHVIGRARDAIEGAREAAELHGFVVHILGDAVTGEARLAGHDLIAAAAAIVRAHDTNRPLCVLASGETTVTGAREGRGGRNQECVLGMAREIDKLGTAVVAASIGTDGVDGPTDAAGGLVDSTTLARAEAADIGPPERYLDEHNSYVFLDELDDLVRTGPTRTNVGDLQVILVGSW